MREREREIDLETAGDKFYQKKAKELTYVQPRGERARR